MFIIMNFFLERILSLHIRAIHHIFGPILFLIQFWPFTDHKNAPNRVFYPDFCCRTARPRCPPGGHRGPWGAHRQLWAQRGLSRWGLWPPQRAHLLQDIGPAQPVQVVHLQGGGRGPAWCSGLSHGHKNPGGRGFESHPRRQTNVGLWPICTKKLLPLHYILPFTLPFR